MDINARIIPYHIKALACSIFLSGPDSLLPRPNSASARIARRKLSVWAGSGSFCVRTDDHIRLRNDWAIAVTDSSLAVIKPNAVAFFIKISVSETPIGFFAGSESRVGVFSGDTVVGSRSFEERASPIVGLLVPGAAGAFVSHLSSVSSL